MNPDLDFDPAIECEHCYGLLNRPGVSGCNRKCHPKPTLEQRIAMAIEEDIADRRGLRQEWESINDEIKREIRDRWVEIVKKVMEKK